MSDTLVRKEYWDSVWHCTDLPDPIDPSRTALRDHLNREFDRLFREVLADTATVGAHALEVGCARSRWLPYFAEQFGFDVTGIDYSAVGCDQARAVAEQAGVRARVVCADVFAPPEKMLGQYDLVYSFGVVEHFPDTTHVLGQLASFLRPGGLIVTVIPNLTGATGALMRVVNRANFDQHVPLRRGDLAAAHVAVGLDLVFARWFGSSNFGVLNLHGLPRRGVTRWGKQAALSGLVACTAAIWALEERGIRVRRSQRWSPYVVCVARRQCR